MKFDFTFPNTLLLASLFFLFIDDILSATDDLPDKTLLLGAQLLHEQVKPGTTMDIKRISEEAGPTLEKLKLKHYWNVQGLADNSRNKLMEVIVGGKEKDLPPGEIAKQINTEVFEKFSNKALLTTRTFITEAEAEGRVLYAKMREKDTGKKQYLQANSAPDACPLCKTYLNFIDGKGSIIEGKIFPVDYLAKQKSNLSKKPKDIKPNIPVHFNCRCIWLLVSEEKYKSQQDRIKKGELKNRKLDEVTSILKKHDKNFKKTIDEVTLEKTFELEFTY